MTSEAAAEDFVFTVDGVFNISGRGPVVAGRIESGMLRSGQVVELWQGDKLIATAEAEIGMVCRPGKPPSNSSRIDLRLRGVGIDLLAAGQTIRRSVTNEIQH